VFNVLQQLEALGLNLPTVLQQLGINPASVGAAAATPATSPVVTAVVAPPES
jgi:hypothetical protein